MSKASRTKKHKEKMERKRAAKLARRQLYASLAGTSKRRKRRGKSVIHSPYRGMHIMSDCGNIGCCECYPEVNRVSS